MNSENNPSTLVRVSSVSFFMVLALGALVWFSYSFIKLISDLLATPPVISFDKGSMYMLGGGVAGILFSLGGTIQGIFRKKLSSKVESFFSKALIISLVLMFGFPHVCHFVVSSFIEKRNYMSCNEAGYSWFLYKKIYYTVDGVVCSELVREKISN